jgi:hypothetical protein
MVVGGRARRLASARWPQRAGRAARRLRHGLVGISAADYTAAAVEQGAPFKILGVAMQKNPFVIASLPANPVNEPADLWASGSAWRWPTRRCCRRFAR